MYEELIKGLREWPRACAEYAGSLDELHDKDADAIEELQGKLFLIKHTAEWLAEKVPKWIPVTERLPKKDGWYQVYAPSYSGGSSSGLKNINGNMYSAFKHGKWSIEVGYHKRPGCVKAWMPLPEPPSEVAK